MQGLGTDLLFIRRKTSMKCRHRKQMLQYFFSFLLNNITQQCCTLAKGLKGEKMGWVGFVQSSYIPLSVWTFKNKSAEFSQLWFQVSSKPTNHVRSSYFWKSFYGWFSWLTIKCSIGCKKKKKIVPFCVLELILRSLLRAKSK